MHAAPAHHRVGPVFWDIGTGAAFAPVLLARMLPGLTVVAADISLPALNVARVNVEQNGVAAQVRPAWCPFVTGVYESRRHELMW